MNDNNAIRRHLIGLLRGKGAHGAPLEIIRSTPRDVRGVRPQGLPYSPWELLEHMRLAQWDIVEFCRNPDHESPEWPAGYWPPEPVPADDEEWRASVELFERDLEAMQEMVADESNDLTALLPQGEPYTLLREALLVADHNSYHLGQFVAVRRLVGAWEE